MTPLKPGAAWPALAVLQIFYLLPLNLCGPAAAAGGEKGWILKQKTGITGLNAVYIARDAIRVERQNTDYVLLLRGPLWKVTFFNKKTRVFYETDAEHFQGRASYGGINLFSGGRFSDLTTRDGGISEQCGIKANRILLVSSQPTAQMKINHPKRSVDGLLVRGGEYLIARDLPVPEAAAHILQRYYSLPLAPGMPLLLRFTNEGGRAKKELDTTECRRQALPQALFLVPAGYRRVSSENAVVMDGEKQGLLDELREEPLRH